MLSMNATCETCNGTGWYGDHGPGIKGNNEYTRCNCGVNAAMTYDERLRARKVLKCIDSFQGSADDRENLARYADLLAAELRKHS